MDRKKIKEIAIMIWSDSKHNLTISCYQNKGNWYLKVNAREPSGLFYYSVKDRKLFIVSHNGGFKMNVAYDSHFEYLQKCFDCREIKKIEDFINKYFMEDDVK